MGNLNTVGIVGNGSTINFDASSNAASSLTPATGTFQFTTSDTVSDFVSGQSVPGVFPVAFLKQDAIFVHLFQKTPGGGR